eukprot:c12317_g1_i1.p2 GENE.c12317_g1_i1~~c12317_g1_i1.p2  ORF type:complete len:209 (-),score=45.70 c12317_g1_i1:748-1374(-)
MRPKASPTPMVPKTSDSSLSPAFVAIAAGAFHALAIDATGSLWSCGNNEYGQLGSGKFQSQPHLQRVTYINASTSRAPKMIGCAAGMYHSLVWDSEGMVYASGFNHNGQLGVGDTVQRDKLVHVTTLEASKIAHCSAGVVHSAFITKEGKVFACGSNKDGQLCSAMVSSHAAVPHPICTSLYPVTTVSAGGCATAIVASSGTRNPTSS